MKKKVICLFLAASLCSIVFAAGTGKKSDTLWVSVETASLREKPGRFSKESAVVAYGTQLVLIDESGDWYYVRTEIDGKQGWIPSGMVTKRKIVVGHMASANADEISLAGKGFSQEVEDLYKEQGLVDFSQIDQIERVMVSEQDMYDFLLEGNLVLED